MLTNENGVTLAGPPLSPRPLTEHDAADRLGLRVATLRAWRHQGKGPAFVRLGRAVRYLPQDLDDYLVANRHDGQAAAHP